MVPISINVIKKIIVRGSALFLAAWFALVPMVGNANISIESLQETISQLLAQLASLQGQLSAIAGSQDSVSVNTVATCTDPITAIMDMGTHGNPTTADARRQVAMLQNFLRSRTEVGASSTALQSGVFDLATQIAVQRFQKARGIVSYGTPATTGYGRVGTRTLAVIRELTCVTPQSVASGRVFTLKVGNSAVLNDGSNFTITYSSWVTPPPCGNPAIGLFCSSMLPTGNFRIKGQDFDETMTLGLGQTVIKYGLEIKASYVNMSSATLTLTRNNSTSATTLGDIDMNGSVTLADQVLLERHVEGSALLTDAQRQYADLDASGSITRADTTIIRKVLLGSITVARLPLRWGDIDASGVVDSTDVAIASRASSGSETLSAEGMVRGDVNMDGSITVSDVSLLRKKILGTVDVLPARFGDINGDYLVATADVVLMGQFVDRLATPTARQSALGDVNGDGVLTADDTSLIRQYSLGSISRFPVEIN